jgi:cytoskeleton protein RodZ
MGDFGRRLRVAREQRGISLQQIAASTKISVAVLEALERDDISKLPGGVFSRGFVRAYAIEVGLEPDQTVHEFLERFQPIAAAPAIVAPSIPEAESNFESQQRIVRVATLLVAVSVPLIVLVLYFSARGTQSSPPRPVAAAAAAPAAETSAVAATTGAVPVVEAHEQAATDAAIDIDIHPSGDCWVRVAADGSTVLSRVMHAGERETLRARNTVVITVGNAGAFAYSINGRPGKPLGSPGQVRTTRITRSTLSEYIQ